MSVPREPSPRWHRRATWRLNSLATATHHLPQSASTTGFPEAVAAHWLTTEERHGLGNDPYLDLGARTVLFVALAIDHFLDLLRKDSLDCPDMCHGGPRTLQARMIWPGKAALNLGPGLRSGRN